MCALCLLIVIAQCIICHWRSPVLLSIGSLYKVIQLPLGDTSNPTNPFHLESETHFNDSKCITSILQCSLSSITKQIKFWSFKTQQLSFIPSHVSTAALTPKLGNSIISLIQYCFVSSWFNNSENIDGIQIPLIFLQHGVTYYPSLLKYPSKTTIHLYSRNVGLFWTGLPP